MPKPDDHSVGALFRMLFILTLLLAQLPAHNAVRAQDDGCRPDREPNNVEAEVEHVEGAFCIAGDLPEATDQDLFLWTVSEADAKSRWTFTVSGPAAVVTDAKIYNLSSPPGTEPIVADAKIGNVGATETSTGPVSDTFIFAPGQYLIGISRTDTLDAGAPATTGYRLSVAAADRLPTQLDREPNDDQASAVPVQGAFQTAGDRQGSYDYYAWTLTEEDAASGWELHGQGALGESLSLTLIDANGAQLLTDYSSDIGDIDLYDLVLSPGTYAIQVGAPADAPSPYLLHSNAIDRPSTDIEPNDQPDNANLIDLANPVIKGRLAARYDVDTFRLTVDDALAGSLFDLRLITRSSLNRQVCLASIESGADLQCKTGPGGATLGNILLPRGEYMIKVSGDPDPSDQYILRVDLTTPPAPEFETEPNDNEALSAVLDPTVPITGQFNGNEWDVYRFTSSGEPQLWDIAVTGNGISQLDLTRRDGVELATALIAPDQSGGHLTDIYLTPGDHWIRVNGADGQYTISLTPLGPPPLDGEHEANNQAILAEPMLVGETKTGRLVDVADTDVFRFSLAATEHIILKLDAPDDGMVEMLLDWGNRRVASASSTEPGDTTTLDLVLLPGEHIVSLTATQSSGGRYAFQVFRDDPFQLRDDQEPNNVIATARPLSPGKEVRGSLSGDDPQDFYAIAPAPDRDLIFTVEGDAADLSITDGINILTLTVSADSETYTIDQRLSDETPLYLAVSGSSSYRLTYGESADSGGPDVPTFFDQGEEAPLEASFTVDTTEIAAYWSESQIVDGLFTLANPTDDPVEFQLASATSHYHFHAAIDDAPASIEPGETLEIPVSIQIEPDAWADIPVQITIAALASDFEVTAFAEITPTADAAAVNTAQAWPLPVDLRGGFDVASPALGATVAGTIDPEGEALLHDGVAPVGSGFSASGLTLPAAVTVDLAGDAPVPVAGIMLNPIGYYGNPQEQVRRFELLLSPDGVNFTTAWTDELSVIAREQYFVLPAPIEATHAQLVILTTYDENPTKPGYVGLGEWSVIATPGFVPETAKRLNIADPALGGHIVRGKPQAASPDNWLSMLTPDTTSVREYPLQTNTFSWVIGFADDRAALITDLAWKDPDGTEPEKRATEVTVEVTTGGPADPWQTVGTWTLRRNDQGAVRRFKLDEPVWARFVRVSGAISPDASDLEYPAQILIYEAPAADDYGSVIGAWGSVSSAGYYELRNPPESPTALDEDDAPNRQEQAAGIEIGATITGRAQIDKDIDWYRITAPEGDNTLTFTITGVPTVDVIARVFDEASAEVPVTRSVSGDSSTIVYTAQPVTPGASYTIRIAQPPHSIVFAFDTSSSIGLYVPMVRQSLTSFANGIEPGQEFVNVIPFDEDPLLETWSDDSYQVYSVINGYYDRSLSSSAESAILNGTQLLSEQEGATAILLITDAETSSFQETAEMWANLDVTRPRVFAVHVAGSSTPVINEHLMQDWSFGGGYYQYVLTQAEMDRAFDRAATWLRRPAGYSLTVTSSFEEVATPEPEPTATPEPTPTEVSTEPGTLRVLGPEVLDGGDVPAAQVSDQVTIEIIFDTSGSMLAAMPDGQRRIDIAKAVLTDLVTTQLPPGVPVTLRVFGNQPDSCDTNLLVPVQPLDPATMAATIQAIEPVNLVKTPLGASLEQVASDLAGVDGPKIVVLVTDGEETCGGDPAAAIQALIDQGIDVQVNIVGFALDDDTLRAQFTDWARIGNGTYFDATNAAELDEAIARAVQAPFRVLDAEGNVVASGTVGGDPIDVPPGTYTVVVLTEPRQVFEEVVVQPGGSIELQLDTP